MLKSKARLVGREPPIGSIAEGKTDEVARRGRKARTQGTRFARGASFPSSLNMFQKFHACGARRFIVCEQALASKMHLYL